MDTQRAARVVCIGGSTGATGVLKQILFGLPTDFPFPIVIAQHIARGFAQGMANWLDTTVGLQVKVAAQRESLEPGQVLITPDDRHLEIISSRTVRLLMPDEIDHSVHVPCINVLFASAARALGPSGIGVLLSGMGSDGADGLLKMRESGAVTLGQDEQSSVVYGMPKAAADRGAVMQALSPNRIVRRLIELGDGPSNRLSSRK